MARTIAIDPAGRLVVPKELRRRAGLEPGTRMRIWVEGRRVVLEPIPAEPELVEDDGLLLLGGVLTASPIDHRELREERIERYGGERG